MRGCRCCRTRRPILPRRPSTAHRHAVRVGGVHPPRGRRADQGVGEVNERVHPGPVREGVVWWRRVGSRTVDRTAGGRAPAVGGSVDAVPSRQVVAGQDAGAGGKAGAGLRGERKWEGGRGQASWRWRLAQPIPPPPLKPTRLAPRAWQQGHIGPAQRVVRAGARAPGQQVAHAGQRRCCRQAHGGATAGTGAAGPTSGVGRGGRRCKGCGHPARARQPVAGAVGRAV